MNTHTDTVIELQRLLRAGYPALMLNSAERVRATKVITRAGWMMAGYNDVHDEPEVRCVLKALERKTPNGRAPAVKGGKSGNAWVLDPEVLIERYYLFNNSEDEEDNVLAEEIGQLLNLTGYQVITWDTARGFSVILPEGKVENTRELYEAFVLLRNPDAFPLRCVFVFNDVHEYMNSDPQYRAIFRSLVEGNYLATGSMRRHILFLQPHWTPHIDISHAVTQVDFALPDDRQLQDEIDFLSASITDQAKKVCPDDLRWDLTKAMRGLTTVEAVNALAYCIVKHRGWTSDMVPDLHRLTAATLAKNDVLEVVPDDRLAAADQIGGFENYLEALSEYKECYSAEAIKVGLKRPKGCLLLGIPGTGKSLVAMATARLMRLPLIKYDFAAVFNQLVGQSEATQRQALRQVSARGPCVLLIDEADKAFSGIIGSSGDSGVGQRVFGRLLTWMANENDTAFVVMTMNRIVDSVSGAQIVPIETLRAGRIETVWFTTFPEAEERKDILAIHLAKNGAVGSTSEATALFNSRQWQELVDLTHEYVGSELEQMVVKAVRMAFVRRKELRPTFEELVAARTYVTPVAKLDDANIKAIDRFCRDRAVPVSRPKKTKMTQARQGRSLELGGASENN